MPFGRPKYELEVRLSAVKMVRELLAEGELSRRQVFIQVASRVGASDSAVSDWVKKAGDAPDARLADVLVYESERSGSDGAGLTREQGLGVLQLAGSIAPEHRLPVSGTLIVKDGLVMEVEVPVSLAIAGLALGEQVLVLRGRFDVDVLKTREAAVSDNKEGQGVQLEVPLASGSGRDNDVSAAADISPEVKRPGPGGPVKYAFGEDVQLLVDRDIQSRDISGGSDNNGSAAADISPEDVSLFDGEDVSDATVEWLEERIALAVSEIKERGEVLAEDIGLTEDGLEELMALQQWDDAHRAAFSELYLGDM